MAFNQLRIVPSSGRDKGGSETDRLIEMMIKQLSEVLVYFKDQQLPTRLFTLWLDFFEKLRHSRTEKNMREMFQVAYRHEEWLGQLMTRLKQQESQLSGLKDSSDRTFAAESALEQRTAQNVRLKSLLTELEAKLQKLPDLQNRAIAAETALNPLIADKANLQCRVRGLEAKLARLQEIEARLFATESALDQRIAENRELRTGLEEAREHRHDLAERFTTLMKPVTEIGGKELDYLTQLVTTVTSMRSELARAILRLADATSELMPPQPEEQTATQPSGQLEQVAAETERRQDWLGSLRTQIEDVEAEARQTETGIQQQEFFGNKDEELPAHFNQLNRLTQILVTMETSARAELEQLQVYKDALETIAIGLPTNIIGVPLPRIPTLDEIPVVQRPEEDVDEDGSVETDETHRQPRPTTFSEQRLQGLIGLAEQHSLAPQTILILTLYDALPDDLKGKSKSILALNSAGYQAGILGVYGYQNRSEDRMEVLRVVGANKSQVSSFLRYYGRPGGVDIYRRTSTSLPWNARLVITAEEEEAFQAEITKPKSK